ncbi:TniQ family protein [uncultured Endozoicomonas sp.]|uniref:TniQ family protein n=1 Tax=uncultured Endozoicomonas sp. TaxID=432652 RepID=UPI002611E587|nr:TniQ family protein [uncultured Endozoicomonas sp.]
MQFLVRPRCYQNESILWYLRRVAELNGLKNIGLLYWHIYKKNPFISDRLIWVKDQEIVSFLQNSMQLQKHDIKSMFLHESLKPKSKKILLRYCPACIESTGYNHIHSHLEAFKFCPVHLTDYEYLTDINSQAIKLKTNVQNIRKSRSMESIDSLYNQAILKSFSDIEIELFGRFQIHELFMLNRMLARQIKNLAISLKRASEQHILSYDSEQFSKKIIINPKQGLRRLLSDLTSLDYKEDHALVKIYSYLIRPFDYILIKHKSLPVEEFTRSFLQDFDYNEIGFIKRKLNKNITEDFARNIFPDISKESIHTRLFFGKKDDLNIKALYLLCTSENIKTSHLESKDKLYIQKHIDDRRFFCGKITTKPIYEKINYLD